MEICRNKITCALVEVGGRLLYQLRKEIVLVNKKSWREWNVLLMSLSLISFMSDG